MAGGNVRRNGRETAERRKRIVELRDEGLDFREIAAELGIDVSTAWRQYQNAMRAIPAAAVEEHQKKVAARLDEQLHRIDMERDLMMWVIGKQHVVISNGHVVSEIVGKREDGTPVYGDPYEDDGPLMQAVAQLQKLDDQEAKLLGLYPKQSVTVSRETSELDTAVIALIEQAKARAAERAARIKGSAAE